MEPSKTVLRVARATERLNEVATFYQQGLGFTVLARFDDHAGFDGVILGSPHAPYHLEFTHEHGAPKPPEPHRESLLVFYLPGETDWREAVARLRKLGADPVPSHNPYWDLNGVTFEDPDGFRIVLQRGSWPL